MKTIYHWHMDKYTDGLDTAEQCINRRRFKNNTSGHKNIYYVPKNDCWTVRIQRNHKIVTCRYFKTKEEAILYRDEFLLNLKGGAVSLA